MTARGVTNLYDLMDAAWDAREIHRMSERLGHVPIIDVNPRRDKDLKEERDREARDQRRASRQDDARASRALYGCPSQGWSTCRILGDHNRLATSYGATWRKYKLHRAVRAQMSGEIRCVQLGHRLAGDRSRTSRSPIGYSPERRHDSPNQYEIKTVMVDGCRSGWLNKRWRGYTGYERGSSSTTSVSRSSRPSNTRSFTNCRRQSSCRSASPNSAS